MVAKKIVLTRILSIVSATKTRCVGLISRRIISVLRRCRSLLLNRQCKRLQPRATRLDLRSGELAYVCDHASGRRGDIRLCRLQRRRGTHGLSDCFNQCSRRRNAPRVGAGESSATTQAAGTVPDRRDRDFGLVGYLLTRFCLRTSHPMLCSRCTSKCKWAAVTEPAALFIIVSVSPPRAARRTNRTPNQSS